VSSKDLTFGGHNESLAPQSYNGRCPSSCVFVRSQMQSLPWLTLPPAFLRSNCPSSNKASLSRNLHAVAPSLVHTLSQEENSILSVATGDNHIYSGSQNQNISVRVTPWPHIPPPRALTRLTCRSGTVAPTHSRHSLEVTQVVSLPSNTRRINTGFLARQVCSVLVP
jgi:hypothetical protein